MLKADVVRLQADEPTLPPTAHTRFCIRNPDDCRVGRILFRGGPVTLTEERWAELVRINAAVNRSIRHERNPQAAIDEAWSISPVSGASYDYAVTKRHELIARGWPARVLLLAEVVGFDAERQVVLLVRTRQGDFVADSMAPSIRPWTATPYRWVRMQCPTDPWFWDLVRAVSG